MVDVIETGGNMNKKIKSAILGVLYLFVIALLITEYLPEIYVYFREGFALRPFSHWKYVETGFVTLWMIILLRSTALWLYKIWSVKKDLFKVSTVINKRIITILAIMLCIMLPAALLVPHTFSLVAHYKTRVGLWGSTWGLLNTISQYVYYVLEGILIVWLIDAFQTTGDTITNKQKIPWGGIGLALTWGVLHYFTKGTTQLIAHTALSIIMGMLFLLGKRNLWPSFILWMSAVIL